MSSEDAVTPPVYEITVGTAGTFTNDANVDIAAEVNQEIKDAPQGDAVEIYFNPGIYGAAESIKLPSDTTMIGNDATLKYLKTSQNKDMIFGLVTNADSVFNGETLTVNNDNGTETSINYADTVNSIVGDSDTAIIDTNISVQGMTLEEGAYNCGTMFVNATDIDVQNNTYINGGDGNAFVNVVNGIVANNIAIGQTNASYDDWNGPVNVTIEDNTSYMANQKVNDGASWSVLINASPSGDTKNPGNAINDAVVENRLANVWSYSAAVEATALPSYGFTYEADISLQGNVITNWNSINAGGLASAGQMYNLSDVDNLYAGGYTVPGSEYTPIDATADGSSAPSVNSSVEGNLVFGIFSSNSAAAIVNDGASPVSVDNAILGANDSGTAETSTTAQSGSATSEGNTAGYGNEVTGGSVWSGIAVFSPPEVISSGQGQYDVQGVSCFDASGSPVLSVTITSEFGTLNLASGPLRVSREVVNGEAAVVFNGSNAEVNEELSRLSYTFNPAGWDDAIEVNISDSLGSTATRIIPVIVPPDSTISNVVTLTPKSGGSGTLASTNASDAMQAFDLSADTIIASSGNNSIEMGGTVSTVLLGTGTSTVYGGSGAGYVVAGAGTAFINLFESGKDTVVGGAGAININAATGNNLIEASTAEAFVSTGGGANTILGGLGSLNVKGGNGNLYIATMPENGGNLNVSLGTGNASIYALSGNATISTKHSTENLIYAGLGVDSISSGGNDQIHLGDGAYTIDASRGGNDTVYGAGGVMNFIGGSGDSVVYTEWQSNLSVGGGNLTVAGIGGINLDVNAKPGTSRVIDLPGMQVVPTFNGFVGRPIVSETQSGGILNVQLSDGTKINFYDPSGSFFDGYTSSVRVAQPASSPVGIDGQHSFR